jgi:hypothetical protein
VDSPTITHLQALSRLLVGELPDHRPDWEVLVRLARQHGLAPLLCFQLTRSRHVARARAPETIREALERDYYASLGRYLRVEYQLAQVLGALVAVEVPNVVVKGLATAAAYPHPALRAFDDLDIWVRRADLDRTVEALQDLEYRFIAPRQEPLLHHHLPQMVGRRGGIPLEIHWRLDDGQRVGRLPQQDLWTRARGWSVAGQPTLRLEAIDNVLHLCRHAVVQNLLHRGLNSLFDFVYLTAAWGSARWDTLEQRAVEYGLARAVSLMLSLQEKLLGLSAPPGALSLLCSAGARGLPSGVLDRLLTMGDDLPGRPVPSTASRAWAHGSLLSRLGYLLRRVFLPPEAMAAQCEIPAGSPRLWLAYLSRPLTLLCQYGPAVWQAYRGEPSARSAWEFDLWLQQWLREEGVRELRAGEDWAT